jgi:hypothetical protein
VSVVSVSVCVCVYVRVNVCVSVSVSVSVYKVTVVTADIQEETAKNRERGDRGGTVWGASRAQLQLTIC